MWVEESVASQVIYRQPAEPGGAMAGQDWTAIGPSRRRFRRGQGRTHEASVRVELILDCTVERKKISRFSSWFDRSLSVGRAVCAWRCWTDDARGRRVIGSSSSWCTIRRSGKLAHWELLADRSATGVCSDCQYCYPHY
jgi:hypothetical protein